MFLADLNPPPVPNAIVTTLDGVTTVLTAFIFVCLVLPSLVKHRPQFYAALACVAGIIAMHTFSLLFNSFTFAPVVIGVLQLLALLLLVLCVGGLTVKELAGDMAKAYEVIRRGETEKEVIIPLPGEIPASRRGHGGKGEEPERKVYSINNPNPNPVIDEDDDTEEKGIPLA